MSSLSRFHALRTAWLVVALAVPAAAVQTLSVVHTFDGADGAYPTAGLVLANDGNYYGTTLAGGTNHCGSVFRMTPDGTVTLLYSFYFLEGVYPRAALTLGADGDLYGTTEYGGTFGAGTVFRITTGGQLTVLHTFLGSGNDDATAPSAALIQAADGHFYGTTVYGPGVAGQGSVFRMTTDGTVTFLHTFTGGDGSEPYAPLLQATNGDFYGLTRIGGAHGKGTVFRMSPAGVVTVVHHFAGAPDDGDQPYSAALLEGADGRLYGLTLAGGAYDGGAFFGIDTADAVTVLHSFDGWQDGRNPDSLAPGADGYFYGTAMYGGFNSAGTLFGITIDGDVTTLHHFSGADGANPSPTLVQAPDGSWYGTTISGGSLGFGVVFHLSPPDTMPPVLNLPADIVVDATSALGATVSYAATATDDVDGDLPVACAPSSGSTFAIGTTTVTCSASDGAGNLSQRTFDVKVTAPRLEAGPANIWLGLKNSDDVGTKFDVLVEILKNGGVVGAGQANSVPGGSSGFNNAVLRTINLALSTPVDVFSGDTLSIRLSVRIAAGSGHRSGTARLWFNDAAAASRWEMLVGGVPLRLYLTSGWTLGAAPGTGPKSTVDVFVDRLVGGNPFKPFGTWSKTF